MKSTGQTVISGLAQHGLRRIVGLPVAGHTEGAVVSQAGGELLGVTGQGGGFDFIRLAALKLRLFDGDGQIREFQVSIAGVLGGSSRHIEPRALGFNELGFDRILTGHFASYGCRVYSQLTRNKRVSGS